MKQFNVKKRGNSQSPVPQQVMDRLSAECASNAAVPTSLPPLAPEDQDYHPDPAEVRAFLQPEPEETDSDDQLSNQSEDNNEGQDNCLSPEEHQLYYTLISRGDEGTYFHPQPHQHMLRLCSLGMRLPDKSAALIWTNIEPIMKSLFHRHAYKTGEFLVSLLPTTPDILYNSVLSLSKGMSISAEEALANTIRTLSSLVDDLKVTSKSYADAFNARENQLKSFLDQVTNVSKSLNETQKSQDQMLLRMTDALLRMPLAQPVEATKSGHSIGSSVFKISGHTRPSSAVTSEPAPSTSSGMTSASKETGVKVTKLQENGLYYHKDFSVTVMGGRITSFTPRKSYMGDLDALIGMKTKIVEGILKAGYQTIVGACSRDPKLFTNFKAMSSSDKVAFYNEMFGIYKDRTISWNFIAS